MAEALGWAPLSRLTLLTSSRSGAFAVAGPAQAHLRIRKTAPSLAQAACDLGTTTHVIRRVLRAAKLGGHEALASLRRTSGRPRKNLFISPVQQDWLLSAGTLRQQVGLSLAART